VEWPEGPKGDRPDGQRPEGPAVEQGQQPCLEGPLSTWPQRSIRASRPWISPAASFAGIPATASLRTRPLSRARANRDGVPVAFPA
jgi:hypothetical protein